MNELISVVLPVYKVEKYLSRCIDSVIGQSYENLEIILVDDGSPDKCGEICDNYAKIDNRIKVIHKANGGLSDARNAGIREAKGEFITFIDSDDYVEKNYVESLYSAICKDNSDISVGAHRAVYENGTVIAKTMDKRCLLSSEQAIKSILYDDGVDLSAWGKLYRTSLFSDIEYPMGRLYEDAATTYKLIHKADKISVIPDVIYNYMIRENSIAAGKFSPKKMDLITSTEEMCEFCTENYPELEKAAKRRLVYAHLSTLSQLAQSREKFPKEQKILMDYIKKNGGEILSDGRVPMRDKIGIISAKFGFGFYKFVWSIYCKVSGRK